MTFVCFTNRNGHTVQLRFELLLSSFAQNKCLWHASQVQLHFECIAARNRVGFEATFEIGLGLRWRLTWAKRGREGEWKVVVAALLVSWPAVYFKRTRFRLADWHQLPLLVGPVWPRSFRTTDYGPHSRIRAPLQALSTLIVVYQI